MDDCKLVELVRENPCLYDVTHAQYRLINMREQVWTKVAEILKQPGEKLVCIFVIINFICNVNRTTL